MWVSEEERSCAFCFQADHSLKDGRTKAVFRSDFQNLMPAR